MSWVPTWAVVEVMGHKVLAGWVTEQDLAGVKFLAVEVPEAPEVRRVGSAIGGPELSAVAGELLVEARPAFTQWFGAAAIFSVSPCAESQARQMASRLFPGQRVAQTPLVTYAEQVGTDSDPEIDFDAEDVPFE